MKELDTLKCYIPDVEQSHIDDDVSVDIVSGYGGRLLGTCKISEVIELIEDEFVKTINMDYYLNLSKL